MARKAFGNFIQEFVPISTTSPFPSEPVYFHRLQAEKLNLNCDNCGAPVTNGNFFRCDYCGTHRGI